jgi:hypothetical protein
MRQRSVGLLQGCSHPLRRCPIEKTSTVVIIACHGTATSCARLPFAQAQLTTGAGLRKRPPPPFDEPGLSGAPRPFVA